MPQRQNASSAAKSQPSIAVPALAQHRPMAVAGHASRTILPFLSTTHTLLPAALAGAKGLGPGGETPERKPHAGAPRPPKSPQAPSFDGLGRRRV
ncbi:MAG: hypothetical protein M3Z96_10615 [Pseudomonadota bacterium]|nr:hypothetical protein [Pseudomonadota bacterium]